MARRRRASCCRFELSSRDGNEAKSLCRWRGDCGGRCAKATRAASPPRELTRGQADFAGLPWRHSVNLRCCCVGLGPQNQSKIWTGHRAAFTVVKGIPGCSNYLSCASICSQLSQENEDTLLCSPYEHVPVQKCQQVLAAANLHAAAGCALLSSLQRQSQPKLRAMETSVPSMYCMYAACAVVNWVAIPLE